MKRKNLPLLLMLIAGAVTCVITLIKQYTMLERLALLLGVMLLFCLLGNILKWTLDRFEAQIEKKLQEEGEVIEKETDGEDAAEEGVQEVSGGRDA